MGRDKSFMAVNTIKNLGAMVVRTVTAMIVKCRPNENLKKEDTTTLQAHQTKVQTLITAQIKKTTSRRETTSKNSKQY